MNLQTQGWNDFFEEHFKSHTKMGLRAGRVVSRTSDHYLIVHEGKLTLAKITGKFRYQTKLNKDFPVVGDWVVYEMNQYSHQVSIHAVLPRENAYVRKLPISGGRKIKNGIIDGGKTEEQVIASNINTAFIIIGLDNNFDLRRIERFLTLVYNGGIEPVIVLNKMDICNHVHEYVKQVESIVKNENINIYTVSAEKEMNMDRLSKYLSFGKTVIFLGSSGVGKSTITNYLLGDDRQKMQSISDSTGKGRHTTTSVELVFHKSGGMIIDTPGVRELQLWGDEDSLDQNFEDIKNLALQCHFNNCQHNKEPGCEIKKTIEQGLLSKDRWQSYLKQRNELQRLNKKRKRFEKDSTKK